MSSNIEMVLLEDAVQSRTHDPWRRGQLSGDPRDNNGVNVDVDPFNHTSSLRALLRLCYQCIASPRSLTRVVARTNSGLA